MKEIFYAYVFKQTKQCKQDEKSHGHIHAKFDNSYNILIFDAYWLIWK